MKKYLNLVLVFIIILISIISATALKVDLPSRNRPISYERAKVLAVTNETLQSDNIMAELKVGYQDIQIEILSGPFAGEKHSIRNSMSRLYNVHTKPGMEVIAAIYLDNNKIQSISVDSYKRDSVLFTLVGLFFIIIILIGGLKGLKSVISLVFTGIMIVFFMIPLIFKGVNPITAALLTASITTVISLLLVCGIGKKTTSAILGTILGMVISGLTAFIAGELAHLSGLTMEETDHMLYIAESTGFSIKGLMFAAILIASLGAIMDVSISIASTVYELYKITPGISQKELFRSGMNVGKDIIGTMSNTLILALAGGSLNLIILLTSAKMPYNQLINLDMLNIELIQAVSGSIGIVLTVPITALLSVYMLKPSSIDVSAKKANKQHSA